ncbi:PREDICTED: homeotic protein caudal isoform X1 [Bactrocera latifrons]|uniref:Homeotic protein caudal n=2 Tax=Bactrocera latifrons TaxID=174628 RepID=A0A0K8UBA8_BACLA|nr:PREDICTED: homeotic protein caudal isoform X1 [Bactrocera latifrons]
MVSYYNPMTYSQKHNPTTLNYPPAQPWQWTANYSTTPNHQLLNEMESSHNHHQVYYNTHHMFHPTGGSTAEWHSPLSTTDNLLQSTNVQQLINESNDGTVIGNSASSCRSTNSSGPSTVELVGINESRRNDHITDGVPSPTLVTSGSNATSPDVSLSTNSVQNSSNNTVTGVVNSAYNNHTSPVKTQYYEWMKKPSYPTQPAPGKTRTKDKYRVVYNDFQRLELEKEYCTSRYITIRRKTELAQILSLSERQVKIWFQNRRAKERKQNKKNADTSILAGSVSHCDHPNSIVPKPKIEPGLHLQHTLHSMATINMPTIGLHRISHHHPFAVGTTPSHPVHTQHTALSAAVATSMPL